MDSMKPIGLSIEEFFSSIKSQNLAGVLTRSRKEGNPLIQLGYSIQTSDPRLECIFEYPLIDGERLDLMVYVGQTPKIAVEAKMYYLSTAVSGFNDNQVKAMSSDIQRLGQLVSNSHASELKSIKLGIFLLFLVDFGHPSISDNFIYARHHNRVFQQQDHAQRFEIIKSALDNMLTSINPLVNIVHIRSKLGNVVSSSDPETTELIDVTLHTSIVTISSG